MDPRTSEEIRDEARHARGSRDVSVERVTRPGEQRRVLASVCIKLALVVSAVALLNIALPDLAAGTGASQTELQWIVDSYALVFAGLLLIAGAVGDKYGRKHTLVGGLATFGLAYAAGAMATDPGLLIGASADRSASARRWPCRRRCRSSRRPSRPSSAPGPSAPGRGSRGGRRRRAAAVGRPRRGGRLAVGVRGHALWAGVALAFAVRWVPGRGMSTSSRSTSSSVLSATGLAGVIFAIIEAPTGMDRRPGRRRLRGRCGAAGRIRAVGAAQHAPDARPPAVPAGAGSARGPRR